MKKFFVVLTAVVIVALATSGCNVFATKQHDINVKNDACFDMGGLIGKDGKCVLDVSATAVEGNNPTIVVNCDEGCSDKKVTDATCQKAFIDRGASAALSADICADEGSGPATRMVANEVCSGWGTVTFDADDTVRIVKNFSLNGSKAFYAYCYPNGSDIRFAPFFLGAEVSPVTGKPFKVIYQKDW
jgi:hypothetical protein